MSPFVFQQHLEQESLTRERCYIYEVFNQPEFEDFSLARARVEAGVTTKLHLVEGATEAYYILSGLGRVEVDGSDQGLVKKGDVVVIPPGVPQRISNVGEEDLVFLCVVAPRFNIDRYQKLE